MLKLGERGGSFMGKNLLYCFLHLSMYSKLSVIKYYLQRLDPTERETRVVSNVLQMLQCGQLQRLELFFPTKTQRHAEHPDR